MEVRAPTAAKPKRQGASLLGVISFDEAAQLAASAFRRAGVSDREAQAAAEALTLAEAMGIATHGLNRVRDYVARIAAGGIDPKAEVVVEEPSLALRLIDGNHGLGPAIARCALYAAMDVAREAGIGAAFVRHGSHLGALAPFLYLAAESGFAAIMTTNTAPMIAPPGGRMPLIGNNPLGLAVPHPDGRHVLVDMALSMVSRSRVRAAEKAGTDIPESWATDADGRPTSDPAKAMEGLLQAIGGEKGAVLALALDLLVCATAGAGFLSHIPNAAKTPERPQNLGQLFILIDAGRLLPDDVRRTRLDEAAALVTSSPLLDPNHPARMPGVRALRQLRAARENGIPVSPALLSDLREMAKP